MISGTIYITINNVNPIILEETKMYNIYSVFRNLFILTLIVLLLSFVLLCVDKKIVKNKKIYKFIDKFQNAVSIICIISLFVFIISLMGFAVSSGMVSLKIKNTMVDYFNTDVKLHYNQLIVDGDEYYEYKYDDKKDEIILDKINSDKKIVIKDVFGK